MPGMNVPRFADELMFNASVAGTVPPGDVCGGGGHPPHAIESRPSIDAALLVILAVAVSIVTRVVLPPKSFTTPYSDEPSQAKSALETRLPVGFGVPLSLTPLDTAPVVGLIVDRGP